MFSGHRLIRVIQYSPVSRRYQFCKVDTSDSHDCQKSKMRYSSFSRSPRDSGQVLVQDCQVLVLRHLRNMHFKIMFKFGLAIHQNDHQARRRFVEWAQNEIAVIPDFHKQILFSDEAHVWLNSYVNKQNCRIWSEANPQVYVETPLHPEKLTVWCALWAGGILLQKR
ncbi:transposase [Trichonephila clavipes]|nr:transposase [Trichonephila clavipes]